jgi:hypothetical protein
MVFNYKIPSLYPNEDIGFLVGFGRAMQYPSTFQKICYGTQYIFGIP